MNTTPMVKAVHDAVHGDAEAALEGRIKAAVELAQEEAARSPEGKSVGGMAIKRKVANSAGHIALGVLVAEVIEKHNYTIEWDMDCTENGAGTFDNFYQYLGAEMFAPNGSMKERVKTGEEREAAARRGVKRFQAWCDSELGVPVFLCSRPGTKYSRVTTLTLYPDYLVAPDLGLTAAENQAQRDTKAAQGALSSYFRKKARVNGISHARTEIHKMIESFENTGLVLEGPKRG